MLAVAMAVVFGNGCREVTNSSQSPQINHKAKSTASGIPMLDVTHPSLATSTSAESIQIKGETDQDTVYVANKAITVQSGEFATSVDLKTGLNIISVETGNGFTTTTISLQITKE